MNLSSVYLRRSRCLYTYTGPTLLPEATSLLRIGRVSVAIRRLTAGMDQLKRGTAGQGPAISDETGTRPKRFSYVYKYQVVTQVE